MTTQRSGLWRRLMVLFLSSGFLWVIYSNPPLQLRKQPLQLENSPSLTEDDSSKFLLDEHKKVTDEIGANLEEENTLFRYKFALVGGLLLAFLAHIAYPRDGGSARRADGRVEELMNSTATCFALALACVIAVTIDLHIRTKAITSHELGLWIANYVEPTYIRQPYLGYETFLRTLGMHHDQIYGFFYWPPLHFLTWILYLLYLFVLQNVCVQRNRWLPQRLHLILGGFVLVHLSIGAFAWMGHTAPSGFEFVLPFGNYSKNSMWPPVFYLIPSSLLFALNFLGYLMPLLPDCWLSRIRLRFRKVSDSSSVGARI
jgi:hypothetical protein